jgi:HAE1 family hydrophobic/amphiphilic exporter-1
MRRWLPAAAWDHPVTVTVGFVALLLLGLLAWVRVPVQMMPSGFDPSFLWVRVVLDDASPKEVDDTVVSPVAGQLATVPGLKSIESGAETDGAWFGLEFYQSVDMDRAYDDVADRIERAMADLPDDVEQYFIYRFNPSDEPIVWAGVSTPDTVDDPYFLLNRVIKPRIVRIPGVAAVDVWGIPQRRVQVEFDRERLITHGVNTYDIQRRLWADSFQMSGGRIHDRGQDRLVRSLSRLDDLAALQAFPVKEGVVLSDVADVRYRNVAESSVNRVDGELGAAMAIRKESSANTVEVARAVEQVLAELSADPRAQGAEFFVFFSQGELIQQSLDTLTSSAVTGGIFSIVILFVFLREWRMTLLISAAIPFSMLLTVAVLYLRGESLNLLAMMGLMLAVGMVVDNAIVVVEAIYRRRAEGASPREAAVEGTGEVSLAIVLSTGTTMVVFLPIILMSENAGFSFFMGVLGFPVVFALAASLLVALVFAPLATRYLRADHVPAEPAWLVRVSEAYARALRWCLTHRPDTGLGLVVLLMLTAIPVTSVQCVGEADGNINDFVIRFSVPHEAGLARRDALVRQFEDLVENHREVWGVRVYRSRLADDSDRGAVFVYLESEPPISREEVIEQARAKLPDDVPGVEASIGWQGGEGGSGNQTTVVLTGEDVDVLLGLADEVRRRLEASEGVLSAVVDQEAGGADEYRLRPKRDQLARYGVSGQSVGQTVAAAMRSNRLPALKEGEREVDVVGAFALSDRSDVDTLLDFPVFAPATASIVPLRALVDAEVARGPSEIHREQRRTSISVTADLDREIDDPEAIVEAALADMEFPRGYRRGEDSSARDQEEDDSARNWALLLSAVFVFLLMGVLFESFLLPLAVITTVPMAMLGAFWGLWLTDTPMDVMAGVGLVVLIGVIVNNGIVLLDLVTQLRAEGQDRVDALVHAARVRLRPILMTALTTIIGLVPMAAGSASFVGIPYAPLGRTVMGGLVAGTLLTLVYVPLFYVLLDDVGLALRRLIPRKS